MNRLYNVTFKANNVFYSFVTDAFTKEQAIETTKTQWLLTNHTEKQTAFRATLVRTHDYKMEEFIKI